MTGDHNGSSVQRLVLSPHEFFVSWNRRFLANSTDSALMDDHAYALVEYSNAFLSSTSISIPPKYCSCVDVTVVESVDYVSISVPTLIRKQTSTAFNFQASCPKLPLLPGKTQ